MVNLELVGGVNFQKGCYPGQEVVARSQYRGTLKRRAFALTGPSAMTPAQEIFHSADPAQPAGEVALSGRLSEGCFAALVELKINATREGSLHLGASDGPLLQLSDLPYAVPLETA
jgi:folate-binding Fe-S cluster repair protein YgfZ